MPKPRMRPSIQSADNPLIPCKVQDHLTDEQAWFRARVEREIGPLLDEYWYDNRDKAREARAKLLTGLV
jgi:hypothetical protein